MNFDVWWTPTAAASAKTLDKPISDAVDRVQAELERAGCAAADYRLTGDVLERICVIKLPYDYRMLVAFPSEQEVAVLLIGRHVRNPTLDVTLSYMAARQFSARMDASVLDRLERRGARTGLNKSRLAERYIDEGIRIEDHPGIVFRDGPAGRRPGLAAGPDVWEVIGVLNGAPERGEAAILYTADYLNLPLAQVRSAVSYYAAYPAEIDEWIARNDEEAEAAEAVWRREQAALA